MALHEKVLAVDVIGNDLVRVPLLTVLAEELSTPHLHRVFSEQCRSQNYDSIGDHIGEVRRHEGQESHLLVRLAELRSCGGVTDNSEIVTHGLVV